MDSLQPVPDEVRLSSAERYGNVDYLERFVHPFLQELIELKKKDAEVDTLYRKMAGFAIDPGMFRERRFLRTEGDNQEIIDIKRPPVAMFNRSGMVYAILEQIRQGQIDPTKIAFQIHDLADFRQADFAKDDSPDQNRYADCLANDVGVAILESVDDDDIAARYGGDEFVVVHGDGTDEDHDEQKARTEANVNKVEGYFNRNGTLVKEQVRLKPGIKRIRPPKDETLAKIFWQQFSHGLLLDESELETIRSLMTDRELIGLDFTPLTKIKAEQMLVPYIERVKAFLTTYPEHQSLFAELQALEEKHGIRDSLLQSRALDYFKETAYDLLLNDYVPSFYHFQDDVAQGTLAAAICLDFKGIKETNDFRSIAKGDLAIKELYTQIMKMIPFEKRNLYRIYRRGGTFIVGIPHGGDSKTTIDRMDSSAYFELSSLKSITFEGAEIPIGCRGFIGFPDYEFTSVESDGRVHRKATPGQVLGSVIESTKTQWLNDVFVLLNENPDYLDKPVVVEHYEPQADTGEIEPLHKGMKRELTQKEIMQLYFWGKRSQERCGDAVAELNEVLLMLTQPADIAKYSALKDRFTAILADTPAISI